MVLPCFHKVKDVFPDAEITLLTNRPVHAQAAPVASIIGPDFFNQQIEYPVGTRNPLILLSLLLQIRRLKFEVGIKLNAPRSMKTSKRDGWFIKLSGIKHFIGFPEKERDFIKKIDPISGEMEW